MGGGRRFFLPNDVIDEEGVRGGRTDSRDLRAEFTAAGYNYVWNKSRVRRAGRSLPVLGLFESGHMEYELDRPTDLGGEPSLEDMTVKAIQLLEARPAAGRGLLPARRRRPHRPRASRRQRLSRAHRHAGTRRGDRRGRADGRSPRYAHHRVSADHSHVFNIAGYPLRPLQELPYPSNPTRRATRQAAPHGHGILDIVWDIDQTHTDTCSTLPIATACPTPCSVITTVPDIAACLASTRAPMRSPASAARCRTAVPTRRISRRRRCRMGSETHSGEDVAIYAVGPGAELVRGTVKNTHIFQVMKRALGF